MRIYVLFSLMAMMLIACDRTGSTSLIKADNPDLAFIGRFDFDNKKIPEFMYSGCEIRATFTGTSVAAVMKDDSLRNKFTVIIDDSLFVLTTNRKDSTYQLADNLQDKRHSLRIIRRTEWHGGNTSFSGLLIDRGKRLYKPEVHDRRIEFIGDSYTCGYGNEGKSREEHFSYETENNYVTFGAIAARSLQAEYFAVCRSGIGIYQGYGGDVNFTMPKHYDEVTMNNERAWDFSRYQPQLVVIDLAGNDLSAPLDSALFVNTYLDFLKRIRNNYTTSKIVCVAGPSNPDEGWQKWRNYIHAVVDRSSASDKEIHYFEFTPFEPGGSDWHPDVEQHRRMADDMTPYLKTLMNW